MGAPSNQYVYRVLGTSRQAMHQFFSRRKAFQEQLYACESALLVLRKDHPRLGLKKAYLMIRPAGIGRDRFVRQMTIWGHALERKYSYIRTTRSNGNRYPNIATGLVINDINRIWQSDTTYFLLNGRFVFLTFIIDVYSRVIIGYCASSGLKATANAKALKMALRTRNGVDLSELIFHSDGATQYRSEIFTYLLCLHGITSSMCQVALNNAYAEKINDVIKNEYLTAYQIKTMEQLKYRLGKTVRNYNEKRHHRRLPKELAPTKYEEYLRSTPITQRVPLLIKDGQSCEQNMEVEKARKYLFDTPATWVANGGAKKILPAFIALGQEKQNDQLALDL